MSNKNSAIKQRWYHLRLWAALIVVLSLVACYGLASLAIDSGSLLQYFLAIVLLVLAVNRMTHIVLLSLRGSSK